MKFFIGQESFDSDILAATWDSIPQAEKEQLEFLLGRLTHYRQEYYRRLKEKTAAKSKIERDKLMQQARQGQGWGYVYVIHIEDNIFKIGHSTNPQKRKSAIQRAVKHPVSLCHVIATPDPQWAEAEIHARFEEQKYYDHRPGWDKMGLTTEVFRLTQEDELWLKSLSVLYPEWWQNESHNT